MYDSGLPAASFSLLPSRRRSSSRASAACSAVSLGSQRRWRLLASSFSAASASGKTAKRGVTNSSASEAASPSTVSQPWTTTRSWT